MEQVFLIHFYFITKCISFAKFWRELIHEFGETYTAVVVGVTFGHYALKLSLGGVEAGVCQELSHIIEVYPAVAISIHEWERLFDIEVRSLSQSYSENLTSSFTFEKSCPESSQFTSGVMIEELREWNSSAHVEVGTIRQKSGVLLGHWKKNVTKFLEI